MDLAKFLEAADAYVALGTSVQDQLKAIVADPTTLPDQNPNALKLIDRMLCSNAFVEVEDADVASLEIQELFAELAEELGEEVAR